MPRTNPDLIFPGTGNSTGHEKIDQNIWWSHLNNELFFGVDYTKPANQSKIYTFDENNTLKPMSRELDLNNLMQELLKASMEGRLFLGDSQGNLHQVNTYPNPDAKNGFDLVPSLSLNNMDSAKLPMTEPQRPPFWHRLLFFFFTEEIAAYKAEKAEFDRITNVVNQFKGTDFSQIFKDGKAASAEMDKPKPQESVINEPEQQAAVKEPVNPEPWVWKPLPRDATPEEFEQRLRADEAGEISLTNELLTAGENGTSLSKEYIVGVLDQTIAKQMAFEILQKVDGIEDPALKQQELQTAMTGYNILYQTLQNNVHSDPSFEQNIEAILNVSPEEYFDDDPQLAGAELDNLVFSALPKHKATVQKDLSDKQASTESEEKIKEDVKVADGNELAMEGAGKSFVPDPPQPAGPFV